MIHFNHFNAGSLQANKHYEGAISLENGTFHWDIVTSFCSPKSLTCCSANQRYR